MTTEISKRFYVNGKVQGVFFRAATRKRAIDLGLTGWVCNLSDGRVEILASGRRSSMEEFETWLWQGPELAVVKHVEVRLENYQHFEKFTIR